MVQPPNGEWDIDDTVDVYRPEESTATDLATDLRLIFVGKATIVEDADYMSAGVPRYPDTLMIKYENNGKTFHVSPQYLSWVVRRWGVQHVQNSANVAG